MRRKRGLTQSIVGDNLEQARTPQFCVVSIRNVMSNDVVSSQTQCMPGGDPQGGIWGGRGGGRMRKRSKTSSNIKNLDAEHLEM